MYVCGVFVCACMCSMCVCGVSMHVCMGCVCAYMNVCMCSVCVLKFMCAQEHAEFDIRCPPQLISLLFFIFILIGENMSKVSHFYTL